MLDLGGRGIIKRWIYILLENQYVIETHFKEEIKENAASF